MVMGTTCKECVHYWVLDTADLNMSQLWGESSDVAFIQIKVYDLPRGAWGICKLCGDRRYFDGGKEENGF